MAAIKNLNPKAEIAKSHQALAINIGAARGLRDVMKTNLGRSRLSAESRVYWDFLKILFRSKGNHENVGFGRWRHQVDQGRKCSLE